MARKQHEIADEEFDDEAGLVTDQADDSTDTQADDSASTDTDEPDTLEPELPEEPAEDDDETHEKPDLDEKEAPDELPELTDEEAATDLEAAEQPDDAEPFAELEGALNYKGTGVFIPEGQPLERLRQSLNLEQTFRAEREQLSAEIQDLKQTRGAEALVAADIMELVFKDFGELDEDGLYEWAVNFKANEGKLKNDLREKYLQHREQELDKRASRRNPADVEREQQEAQAAVQATIQGSLEELYKRPELADLTPQDKATLLARATERAGTLVLTAQDDSFASLGIRKGDKYLNSQQMYEWAADRAEVRSSEKKRQSAAVANARRLGKGKLSGAKGPGSGARSSSQTGSDEWKPAKTREEWLARMEAD